VSLVIVGVCVPHYHSFVRVFVVVLCIVCICILLDGTTLSATRIYTVVLVQ
jgi:hypothetical protein